MESRGIYTLANHGVFDQLVAFLNPLEVNVGSNLPIAKVKKVFGNCLAFHRLENRRKSAPLGMTSNVTPGLKGWGCRRFSWLGATRAENFEPQRYGWG